MYGSAFSSPYIAEIGGTPQLLVQTRTSLAGVEPGSGEVLWSKEVPAFRGMNILTPTVFGDRVFTSSYGGGTLVVEVGRDGEEFSPREVWKNATQGYMSTPVVINGHAYMHLRNQRMVCFRLEDGEKRWTTRERFGKYMSLVAQGDRILALDDRGMLLLLQADPERFVLLGSRKISDQPTWAHLAVVGNELFVRELRALTSYRWGAVVVTDDDETPAGGAGEKHAHF